MDCEPEEGLWGSGELAAPPWKAVGAELGQPPPLHLLDPLRGLTDIMRQTGK